jgi:hypothetical protein
VPKDFSFRTIYLPGFSITDPLNCITFAESQFFNDKFNPLYRVTLENSCSDVSSRDFSKFELELKIPGYFQYISSQSIYSLSNYGSTFDFFLRDIKSGTYFPFLEIRDNYYKTRKIELNPLFIATSPTPIAKKTYNNNGGITPTQVCSLSKNFAEQCADYPNFSFDFCSSLQKASLQEKVGTKWVFLWNVSGKKDSTICTDNKYPFYILVSGQNKSYKKSELRLIFSKTSNISSYTQYFTLEFRR